MKALQALLGVARYERIMLMRTMRYRVLGVLGISFPLFMGIVLAIGEARGGESALSFGLSAFVPFYIYSFLQTLVVAFVAGDFRAADERAHVQEVLAVRPLSTTEIVVGKYLGVLQALLALSLAVMAVTIGVQAAKLSVMGTPLRIAPYLGYFLLMNVPGLIFMTAVTFWLGAMLRHRTAAALTALAYAMGTIFVLAQRYGDIWDFGAFYAPLYYSDTFGFGDLGRIASLRALYTAIAVFLVCTAVERYPRLSQAGGWRLGGRVVAVAALAVAVATGAAIRRHDAASHEQRADLLRAHVTRAELPAAEVLHYDLDVRLAGAAAPIQAESRLRVRNPGDAAMDRLVMTLNAGLELSAVAIDGGAAGVERDGSVVAIPLSPPLAPGEERVVSLTYAGDIDRNAFDLLRTTPRKDKTDGPLRIPEITAWVHPHSVHLPARSGWYPAPGVDYGHPSPPPPSFSTATLRVTAPAALEIVSQGQPRAAPAAGGERTTEFRVEEPVPLLSLTGGVYSVYETDFDDLRVALYIHPEHTGPVEFFADAGDEVLGAIGQLLAAMERETGLAYPYPRLNLVEVPMIVQWYYEGWREHGGLTQPGVLMIEEDVLADQRFARQLSRRQRWSRGELDVPSVKRDILLSSLFRVFLSSEGRWGGLFRSPLVQLWSYDRAFVGEQASLLERGMPVYLQEEVGNEVRSQMFQRGRGRGGDFGRGDGDRGEAVLAAAASAQRSQSGPGMSVDWDDVLAAMQQESLRAMDPDADPELYRAVLDSKGVAVFRMMKAVVGADVFVGALEEFAEESRHAGIDFDSFQKAVVPVAEERPPARPAAALGERVAQLSEAQRARLREMRAAGMRPAGGQRAGRQPPGAQRRRQDAVATAAPAPHDADLDRLVREWLHGTSVPGYTITRATAHKVENARGQVVHQVTVRVRNAEPGLGFVRVKAAGFRDEVSQGAQVEGGSEIEVAMVIADRPTRVTVEPYFAKNRRALIAPLRVPDLVEEGRPASYVRLVTDLDPGFIEIIVDNEDEGFSMPTRRVQRYFRPGVVGDNWAVRTAPFAFGRYDTNYRFKSSGDGAQPAVWEATLPRAGEYDVAFYFLPETANGRRVGIWGLASEFDLTLVHAGSSETLRVDTSQLRGGWNVLGRFRYEAGERARIELSDRADGRLYADAVRWRFFDPDNPGRVYEEDVAPWDLRQFRRPGAGAGFRPGGAGGRR